MRRALLAALAVAVCGALVAGCGKGDEGAAGAPTEGGATTGAAAGGGSAAEIKKATTPQQTMQNMQAALMAGDQEAFVACFDVTAEEEKSLAQFCEFVGVTVAFEEALKKEYGATAAPAGPGSAGLDELKDAKWLDEAKVDVSGDTATITKQDGKNPVELVKDGGVWKVKGANFAGQSTSAEDAQKRDAFFRAMIDSHKAAMAKIGQPGYTAQKVRAEAAGGMFGAMMQGLPKPPEGDQ